MKKLLFSLLTLAAALTVTSCLKEVEGAAVYDDGTLVDAVFTVDLGPQTKALDDGLLATDLYAGLYEVVGSPSTFKHVVHTTEAQALVPGTNKWKVVFPSSLKRGHSYEVVFWAQANGAPYTIDWATGENVTTGPTVTVETGGPANDKTRDAFYNIYSISEVSQSENMENDPISLYRPFAQINILVPNDNVDKKLADLSAGGRTSSMTVSGLPNVLSLSKGTTSGEADYIFTLNDILEPAFGTYAETHQYMAMNYVLFGETGKFYPVTFEVNNDTQGSNKKTVSVPVQPNTRTNIVGNIFADDFDFTGWATTSPGHWTGENVADYREVKIRVGGSEISSSEPETVAVGENSVLQLDFSGTVTGNITATSSDGNIATVSVDQTAKTVTVHGVADGVVTITIVIPAGTKADTYAERTLNVRYKVGTGGSQAQKEDQNLSFAESYQTVTLGEPYALQQATGAHTAVTYTSSNSAVATIDEQENFTIVGVGTTTITATAAENEYYNEGSASYELEVVAPGKVATPAFSPAAGEYTAAQSVEITCSTEEASIYYTTDGSTPTSASTAYTAAIAVGETMTIKAIAIKEGMTDSEVATAVYTINIPQVATPTFDPAEGAVASGTAITIATTTPGATIYYTMGENPADPTTSSTQYDPNDKPKVTAATTIKAIAVKGGMENSEVATAVYTIKQPTTLFLETFGDNGNNNTLVASATTYTATTSMFTDPTSSTVVSHYLSDGKVGKGTVNVSTGYSNASGSSAVFYQAGAGGITANLFTVDKIDISSATEISISFGLFYTNGNIGTTSTITAYYTVDDGSEKTLSFTQPASTSTWTLCTKSISETGNSLKIRFELVTTGGYTVRIDDIKVTGTK